MEIRVLFISFALLLGACSGNTPSAPTTDDSTVQLLDENNVKVYGGSTYQMEFTTNPLASPVTWESDDETVASVDKSLVTFKNLDEVKTVKITANSKNNPKSKDSRTFVVIPNVIDFDKSSDTIDFSDLNKRGAHFSGDNATMLLNLSAPNFYAEATFRLRPIDSGKCGFYLTNNSDGTKDSNSELIYINVTDSMMFSGFPYLYHSIENNVDEIVLPYQHIIKEDYYTIGISKVDDDLFIYGEWDDGLKCYEHYFSTSFGNEDVKIGIFTENVEMDVKNMNYLLGDDIKSMFRTPTRLFLSDTYKVINVGDTYDICVQGDYLNFDKSKLSYLSSKEGTVTITDSGVVTGVEEGATTLTVKYDDELDSSMTLIVLSEESNIIMDGEMNDSLYTEDVKKHSYRLSKDANNYIDFYASRTIEGAYIFADYYVSSLKNAGSSWWHVDNFECYFGNEEHIQVISQYYVSKIANNFDRTYITDPVFDSEKNLYNMHFEVFVSFKTLNSPYDGLLTFGPGFNPQAGWVQSPARGNQDIYAAIAITRNGFARFNGTEWVYDEPVSPGEEEYQDLLSTVTVKDPVENSTGTASMNPDNWTKMVHSNNSNNFTYTIKLNQNGGIAHDTASDSYLSHVRLYIYDANGAYNGANYSVTSGKLNSAFVQSRSDWSIDSYNASGAASSSDSIYTTKNSGSNYLLSVAGDNWKTYMKNYFADVDTSIVIQRDNGTIMITYNYVGKVTGYLESFTMTQTMSGLKTNNIGIALCGRKVSFTLSEFYKGVKE